MALTWLLLCLALAQTGLLLHRVVHADAAAGHVQHGDAPTHPLKALFESHADTGDCLNFDHACGGDGAPVSTLSLAALRPPMAAPQALPWHFHRSAPAAYDARAPPTAT